MPSDWQTILLEPSSWKPELHLNDTVEPTENVDRVEKSNGPACSTRRNLEEVEHKIAEINYVKIY